MNYTYIALFQSFEDKTGYTVTFPDINGAVSEAKDLIDANKKAREVLEIFALMAEDDGFILNNPSSAKELSKLLEGPNDLLQVITVDTDIAREKEKNKSVNKMVTLPAWLVDLGKEHKINFSQLLQRALKEELDCY